MQEGVFACDLNAISPEQRPGHTQLTHQLFATKQATYELPNGYRFESCSLYHWHNSYS